MSRAHRNPMIWTVVGALLAVPAVAGPTEGAGEALPVTDPLLLERMGFAPDAPDVYATPQALEDLRRSPTERVVLDEARLEELRTAREVSSAGGPFGTSSPGFSPLSSREFRPMNETVSYGYNDNMAGLFCISGNPFFVAQFQDLPHGGAFQFVEVWYWDNSNENSEFFLNRVCQPDHSAGPPTYTLLGSVQSVGAPGHDARAILVNNENIDQHSCYYRVIARLDGAVMPCSEDQDLGVHKARAWWRRQVSPAPAVATFDDVPTSHPFFQHIEALVGSAITSGCGGDDFCPGDPITRGQMAVFLAKALGLHWAAF